MHDDGTLYYAHYTPQLHYRGIALDDDDNMMTVCCPLVPHLPLKTLAQNLPEQPGCVDHQLGQCAELMHRLSDDHKICTEYRSLPGQATHQSGP